MRQLFILGTLCLLSFSWANAQTRSVTGVITDTINQQNLANTTIALLRSRDSVLVSFTRSDLKGKFTLTNIPAGKFLLMITYPGYADYVDDITINDSEARDLGLVKLTLKARLLEEVFVKQRIAAVRLRGDTIEFNADSFQVREGASVEEMLRKMPGLQVDKDGNVTAQGTRVEKVLVDGEEFFGDDPTMATKNLQAKDIDKVQVFDKKSDQAVFTGIDDGSKTKTINLTLKEGAKKGYFGKIELGGGLANRWNNSLMFNSFKAKRKLSVYGIMSSTGKTGLNWQEKGKYGGGGDNMEYDEDGGYFVSYGGNDEFDNSRFYGQGIPTAWNGGVQYSKKFDADKQNINGSYRYGKIKTAGGGNTISQSILPDNVFTNREANDFLSSKQRHSLNATYEYQLDSFTSIKLTSSGFVGNQSSLSTATSSSVDSAGNAINTSSRNLTSNGTNNSLKNNLLLRRRFRKIGRTFSLSLDQQSMANKADGFLNTNNVFLGKTGQTINVDTVDQQKINDIINSGYYSKLAFTEPVVKNVFVELSYGIRVSNSEAKRLSFDRNTDGKYETLNPLFSNHFNFKVVTNSTGMTWRYNYKKVTLSGGGDVAFANFRQRDVIADTALRYRFTNFFPRGLFQYKFNSNSRLSLNYKGVTQQPTIEQLQPIRDNSNPLNIAVGNPDLTQQFRHSFDFNFNSYKVLQKRGIYTYASFTTVSNAISTNETTATTGDTIGKRTFQYINLNGNYNGYSGGTYNMNLSKLDLDISFGFNVNVSRYNSIVNNQKNRTDNNSYGLDVGINKSKENKFDFNFSSSVTYNRSVSTINKANTTNFFTQRHSLYANLTLPYKFELNSDVTGEFRQKVNAFDQNNNVVLWNGYIGRKVGKNDKGMVRLQANDILNQNKGYDRFVTSSVVREETFQQLRRFFLLTFVYNFSKAPGGNAGK